MKVWREGKRISGYFNSKCCESTIIFGLSPFACVYDHLSRKPWGVETNLQLHNPDHGDESGWEKGEGGLRLTCTSSRFPWTHRWRCWDTAMSCTRSAAARCTLGAHYHLRRHIRWAANGNRAIQVTCQLRRTWCEHTRLWHHYLYEPTDLLAVGKQQIHVYTPHIQYVPVQ